MCGRRGGQVLSLEIGEVVKEALWATYPKALVHQPGTFGGKLGPGQRPERTVRAVLGTPMNAGATPEGAAEAWLNEWSDVFGVLDVTLERAWMMPLAERAEWSIHKSVVRYAQVMGGLPVAGSDVRVMTARQKGVAAGSPGSERVISVEALVLPRPESGLTPTLSAKEAAEAASKLRPTILGPDSGGDACGSHVREPLVEAPDYPGCFSVPTFLTHSVYKNGTLMAALWMDTRAELGFADTRSLFATWTPLAVAPGYEIYGCQPCFYPGGPPCSECYACAPDEGAGANTLHEVLIADDDDEQLSNGTPNDEALCAIYAARQVFLEIDESVCEEHAPGSSYIPDCDCSGNVDLFDALLFQNWFVAGSAEADVNGDNNVDILDWIAFCRAFTASAR